MTKAEQKRLVLLVAVLVVVGIIGVVQLWNRQGMAGARSEVDEITYRPYDIPDLIATQFEQGSEDRATSGEHRNPFTYGAPPTPTPNLTPRPTPTPPPARTPRPTPTPNLTPPPTPRPRPPAFDRDFIGHLGPDRLPVAVFRKQGAEDVIVIDVAIAGDILDDTFIVREIGLESVLIGYVGFDQSEDTRVPLAEE